MQFTCKDTTLFPRGKFFSSKKQVTAQFFVSPVGGRWRPARDAFRKQARRLLNAIKIPGRDGDGEKLHKSLTFPLHNFAI